MMTTSTVMNPTKSILITGVAGFIGSHMAHALLESGYVVIGIDSLSDYYDVEIKKRRLRALEQYISFAFYSDSVSNTTILRTIFTEIKPNLVIHLAAQAGVVTEDLRLPSYIESNVYGMESVVQLSAQFQIPLLYASSSSVYGDCPNIPFRESEIELSPKSFYAATKLHDEHIVAFYAKHLGLKAVGLRFFSVYGEDMRPDMAISRFTSAIYHHYPITLYGDNNTARDFTYIGDLILVMKVIMERLLADEQLAPIYNIGNQSPVSVIVVLRILERLLGSTTEIRHSPLRLGESQITFSDSSLLYQHFNIRPATLIEEGLKRYVNWYLEDGANVAFR